MLCRLGRVDVDVCARSELLCERGSLGPAPDRGHFVAKLVRELNRQVAQAADTLHGDKIAGKSTALSKRPKRGNSGTEQRRSFGILQAYRYCDQGFHRSHHVLLVPAVVADAWNFQI